MSPETPRDDPARTGTEPVHVSVHVALDTRRNVWLEVDLDGKRVAPETARNLSSLLLDMATVAEKLRGAQAERNSNAVAPERNHRQVPAGDRNNQAAPAAAPAGMPTQWQEVDHDEPRYTGPAQAPSGQPPNAQGHGGQPSGGQGAGTPQDRQ